MGKTKVTEYINLSAVRKVADFSVQLLRNTSASSDNTLISPASLLSALNLAQYGARGITEKEMESTIFWDAYDLSDLLSKMFTQKLDLEEQMWNTKIVRYANAVWLCDDGRVEFNERYINTCKEASHAEIIRGPFDSLMVKKINQWAAEKTCGAIPEIVQDLPQAQVMLLTICSAFDPMCADFSEIGAPIDPEYNLCIGDITQHNKIQVNEEGTKAYSITGIDTLCCYTCIEPEHYKVYLDRPFLYMIVDQKTNLPLFMGTITTFQ